MKRVVERIDIGFELAYEIVGVAVREGERRGVSVTVAVVDSALGLVAHGRADGSMQHSVETSRRKANTASSTRRPSGWMSDGFALELPAATGNLLTNIRGGFPIVVAGRVVGGVGVAGGTPVQDAEIGLAVLAAVGAEVEDGWDSSTSPRA
jgi:uncharacterized protein GlcG (DUF336 family)